MGVTGLILSLGLAVPLQTLPAPDADAKEAETWKKELRAILAREPQKESLKGPAPSKDDRFSAAFRPLPEVVPATMPGLANKGVQADPKLDAARKASARALFDLATQALQTRMPRYARADEALRLVLERDPDHAEARRLLGYVPHKGGWATPFAVEQTKRGRVPHPVYGWVDAGWVPNLELGKLPTPAGQPLRWLPAAEADAMRSSFAQPWQINTEHFQILTNVPLAEAISFGHKLEALHDLFLSRFADLLGLELPLAQLARRPELRPTVPSKKLRVRYYAKKSEYVEFLTPFAGPGIAQSLGIYISLKDSPRSFGPVSYFFRDEGGELPVEATLFHEGSHQILFECGGPDSFRENSTGYWVFEGLGTYFETMRPERSEEGTYRVGGVYGPRMLAAKRRLLDRHEIVPVQEFVRFRKARFNKEEDVHLHYAQAMALTVYLLDGKDGAYREGFLDYARDAYKGRLNVGGRGLEDRLGVPMAQIEAELLEFLKNVPDDK